MKKLFCYLKDYCWESILGPLFKLCEALLELLVPLIVADIIDHGIAQGDGNYILRMSLRLVGHGLLGLAFSVTAQYFAARASVGFTARVRDALFTHISHLPYTELDTLGTSTMLTRLTSDMNQVQNGLNLTLRLLLRSPFVVFGAMVMAFTIDGESALIFAATIPALSVVVFGIMLWCIPLYQRVQGRLDRVTGLVRENLSGARVVRAFAREEEEIHSFEVRNQALTSAQRYVGRLSAAMNPLTYAMINGAIIWLLWTGAVRIDSGVLTGGQVVALYNYMSQILVELIKLANLIINLTRSVACARRISAIMDIPTEVEQGSTVPAPVPGAPTVELRDVSLRYRGASGESLSHLSFSAAPGETIGIIGSTGSGKSSCVGLLYRAYDASDGTVYLHGRPVSSYPLADLRRKIGLVPQHAMLFRGTIRENLQYGQAEADDATLWEALRLAQAGDFVQEKPGGLDFMLEAGGRNLSGGQRQRLTIARALVRRPQILILDDSSSALDYATDAALRRALRTLEYHPTVFVVSQRTSSLAHADRIVVLDEGRMVGLGRHEELLQTCEVYQEIYASQYKKENGKENTHG